MYDDIGKLTGELDRPELVFGLVGAVGVSLGYFAELFEEILRENHYSVRSIHVSRFLTGMNLPTPMPPSEAGEFQRLSALMTRGDELRKLAGPAALAIMTAAEIHSRRPQRTAEEPGALPGHAFIVRQLKHPDEVELLRRIYGPAFYLIGLYTPKPQRKHHLRVVRGLSPDEVEKLIERDEGEAASWGQQLRDTFHRCDVFVRFDAGYEATEALQVSVRRVLDLIFGNHILTPTKDEFGMYFADAAALRSADLSRQVGAAILTKHGEVLAVGMNDVPRSGGGLYWDGDGDDKRDFVRKGDSNEEMKRSILREVLEKVDPEWQRLDEHTREARIEEHAGRLGGARIMNLTEFGRAVHAEMEAITAAARSGIPIRGATLYTTTFPCHNCAKHIVAAGIDRVVYVEPYPKSLALDLHDDSICLDENTLVDDDKHKVRFESFVGIAPRRYASLFSTVTPDGRRVRRKTKGGKIVATPLGVRQKASPLSYIEREFAAALIASKIGELPKQESLNEPTGTAPQRSQ